MDKADIFFGRTLKLTLGWKIRSHRSENGKKIMGEDPQSLENHGFPQISQLVLHSNKPLKSHDFSGFLHFPLLFCLVYSCTCCLTHTPTHTGNFSGKGWSISERIRDCRRVRSPSSVPLVSERRWSHGRNKRVDYINDWWNVVNWDLVEQKYGCSCVSLRGK